MSSSSGAMPHAACTCVDLAENEIGAVSLCPQCGVVTMRLQYLSLRFETEAFERVASLVNQARARIDGPRASSTSRHDEPSPKPH